MFDLLRVITVTVSFHLNYEDESPLKWCGSQSFTSVFQYFPYTLRVTVVSEHSDNSANSGFCYHASGYQITFP